MNVLSEIADADSTASSKAAGASSIKIVAWRCDLCSSSTSSPVE